MKLPDDQSSNIEDVQAATAANYAGRQSLLAHASGSTAYGLGNDRVAFGGRIQGATPAGTSVGDTPRNDVVDTEHRTPRAVSDLGGVTPQ